MFNVKPVHYLVAGAIILSSNAVYGSDTEGQSKLRQRKSNGKKQENVITDQDKSHTTELNKAAAIDILLRCTLKKGCKEIYELKCTHQEKPRERDCVDFLCTCCNLWWDRDEEEKAIRKIQVSVVKVIEAKQKTLDANVANLIKLGADVNYRADTARYSLLHIAINYESENSVKQLVDAGADVDESYTVAKSVEDTEYPRQYHIHISSPIELAMSDKNIAILKLLLPKTKKKVTELLKPYQRGFYDKNSFAKIQCCVNASPEIMQAILFHYAKEATQDKSNITEVEHDDSSSEDSRE